MGEASTRKPRRKTEVTPKATEAALILQKETQAQFDAHQERMREAKEHAVAEAERILTEHATKSAQKVIDLQDAEAKTEFAEDGSIRISDPRFLAIQLRAAQFNLERLGIGAREKTVQPVIINITQSQATKVQLFAQLEGAGG